MKQPSFAYIFYAPKGTLFPEVHQYVSKSNMR